MEHKNGPEGVVVVESVCRCFSHIEQGLLLQCKNSYQIMLWGSVEWVYISICDFLWCLFLFCNWICHDFVWWITFIELYTFTPFQVTLTWFKAAYGSESLSFGLCYFYVLILSVSNLRCWLWILKISSTKCFGNMPVACFQGVRSFEFTVMWWDNTHT